MVFETVTIPEPGLDRRITDATLRLVARYGLAKLTLTTWPGKPVAPGRPCTATTRESRRCSRPWWPPRRPGFGPAWTKPWPRSRRWRRRWPPRPASGPGSSPGTPACSSFWPTSPARCCPTSASPAPTGCWPTCPRPSLPTWAVSSLAARRVGEWLARIVLSYGCTPRTTSRPGGKQPVLQIVSDFVAPAVAGGVPGNRRIPMRDVNDIDAILAITNTDTGQHGPRGGLRFRHALHLGLRPVPPRSASCTRRPSTRSGTPRPTSRGTPRWTRRRWSSPTPPPTGGLMLGAAARACLPATCPAPPSSPGATRNGWLRDRVPELDAVPVPPRRAGGPAVHGPHRETVPWIDAKYYASTQVMDEARHVEVYSSTSTRRCPGITPSTPTCRSCSTRSSPTPAGT